MAAGVIAKGGGRDQHHGAGWGGAVEMVPEHDRKQRRVERTGVVEIEFGCGARVRLRGDVSFDTLRQVIELLR